MNAIYTCSMCHNRFPLNEIVVYDGWEIDRTKAYYKPTYCCKECYDILDKKLKSSKEGTL